MSATTPAASTFATPAKVEPAPPARGDRAELAVVETLAWQTVWGRHKPVFDATTAGISSSLSEVVGQTSTERNSKKDD